ncbi:MAG TPA: DUF1127 domain-containing protein [Alphaproteobacteria bacterium]|nr:DUF1127 domain-containing protein [Alphaproteobacteria bacterium]
MTLLMNDPVLTLAAGRRDALIGALLGDALGGMIARFRAWRLRRRHVRALMAMDDRALLDLGIGRSEIDHAVAHGRAAEPELPAPSNSNAPAGRRRAA